MRRFAYALALPLLATSLVAQTETKTLSGKDVAIWNLAGRMRAVAGSGSAVTVEITRSGRDASQLKILTGPIRGQESLRIVYPSDEIIYPDMRRSGRTTLTVNEDGTFGGGDGDGRWNDRNRVTIRGSGDRGLEAYADIVVNVPKGQRISINLAVGRIEVTNVDGELFVDASSADVDVNGTKGVLNLDTGSGRVGVRNVIGDVVVDAGSGGVTIDKVSGGVLDLDSGSGSVEITDADVKELKADVGSGGVRITGLKSPNVNLETGSGSAYVELLGVVDRVSVETGSGGVTITAPANLGAEIDAETGSGGFSSDFEILSRRFGRQHVEGTIGNGKGRIHLESGSGSIRLLKR
jgi:lia operon protein LiaG